jgi:polysaccharide deacetylase family protein (PEP-CTERM system associated)
VRAISACGHEVASYGYAHQRLYTQPLSSSALKRGDPRAFSRIPLVDPFSVTIRRAIQLRPKVSGLWLFAAKKLAYDSSIFPIHHDLCGIPSAPRFCHVLQRPGYSGLVEFPLSTLRQGSLNLPIAGGGYFRLFSYALTRRGMRRLNAHEHRPAVVYLHPREIDPAQPRIQAGGCAWLRHYLNLHRTLARLQRLLQDFRFATMVAAAHAGRPHAFIPSPATAQGSEARNGTTVERGK